MSIYDNLQPTSWHYHEHFAPETAAPQRNPEQAVIDAIDELVNESLAHGPTDDYNDPFDETCPVCGGEWHGLPYNEDYGGCPGAHAAPEQRAAYQARQADDLDLWTDVGYASSALTFTSYGGDVARISVPPQPYNWLPHVQLITAAGGVPYVCQVSDVWLSHDMRCNQCQRHLGTVTTNIEQLDVTCPECQDMINRSRRQGDST